MIVVVGLSHRSAPLSVRERLALSSAEIPVFLRELRQHPEVGEALLISTCNRVELVVSARELAKGDLSALVKIARSALAHRAPNADRHLYHYQGGEAVRHLFRVAASLDSLVVGEPQILGQVKAAFDTACQAKTVGAVLHRVVSRALRAAKRARSQTAIGAGQVSVSSVALDLAEQIFGSLDGRTVVLLGSGEMGETVARLLHQSGAKVLVVGRNADRIAALALRFDAQGLSMAELEAALTKADVVVTSTSAPHYVVDHALVSRVRKQRRGRSLFFIDVAVPRDVDPAVGELDGVFLYNVDDLAHVVSESVADRQREAEEAERIVLSEAADYERWLGGEQVTPTIVALRSHFESVISSELERSLRGKLKHLSQTDREALKRMTEAAVNKLLHAPSSRLRRAARGDAGDDQSLADQWASALDELFALEGGAVSERPSIEPPAHSPEGEATRAGAESMGRSRVNDDSLAAGSTIR